MPTQTVQSDLAVNGGLTINKTSQASAAEVLLTAGVTDDAVGTFVIENSSSTDGVFAPRFRGNHAGAGVGLNFQGRAVTDTGVNPVLQFVGQIGTSDVATRPVMGFYNRATQIAQFAADYNLRLTGPATSPTPGNPGTDFVGMVGEDSAAADRNLKAINEANEIARLTGLSCRVASNYSINTSTTLANVTGLTRNVEAGRKYGFRAILHTTSTAGQGVKVAIGGTCTATSIIAEGVAHQPDLANQMSGRVTSLGSAIIDVSTGITALFIVIYGHIVVNAAGTLTVQFAQSVSGANNSTVLAGSTFTLFSTN